MSLVGPRPALPEEVALYPPDAHRRHAVPPGITGLWQVSGRADIGFSDMIALDLDYARRASLRLDLHILLRTFRAVTDGTGAY
jgi:lipopolysaccharide/colanic/teichoic acid biosynthesis glycosyltransferase